MTPRQRYLLAEVKADRISCNGACLGTNRRYCMEREPRRYPRSQRRPTPAEMQTLQVAGHIKVKRMDVTLTAAGRKALKLTGG